MIKRFLVLLGIFVFCASAAEASGIETTASHAIIIDGQTGTVLLDKKADERMPTSSMSKTMSMYMVFEALQQGRLKLEDTLPVSEKAWRMEGSKMFIHVGDKVKVEDLIRGVIIQSGNDATVALAEGLSGTEESFVEGMNTRAKDLGMNSSHFMNASGWPDPEHYSTPRDLALLAARIISDFPEHYHYFSQKEFTYNKIRQQNRDPLLGRVEGADGLKTGHTEIAGYGLIGSAKRGERRVILVMNGLADEKARQEEGVRLMEWAFRNFENKKVVSKGEVIDSAKVWLGKDETVPLVAERDMTIVLPNARRNEAKFTVLYTSPVQAPLKKEAEVGVLKIELPDQQPVEVKLLAANDVDRKGIFGRVKDRLSYMVTGSY